MYTTINLSFLKYLILFIFFLSISALQRINIIRIRKNNIFYYIFDSLYFSKIFKYLINFLKTNLCFIRMARMIFIITLKCLFIKRSYLTFISLKNPSFIGEFIRKFIFMLLSFLLNLFNENITEVSIP